MTGAECDGVGREGGDGMQISGRQCTGGSVKGPSGIDRPRPQLIKAAIKNKYA